MITRSLSAYLLLQIFFYSLFTTTTATILKPEAKIWAYKHSGKNPHPFALSIFVLQQRQKVIKGRKILNNTHRRKIMVV